MLDLDNFLFNPFLWDKDVYKFNRFEKDMNPYSVHKKGNKVTLVHNVTGMDKKDISVKMKNNKLIISGETKDEETGSKYSVHSEFALDKDKKIKDISSKMNNGLLYITIEYDGQPKLDDGKVIEIQ